MNKSLIFLGVCILIISLNTACEEHVKEIPTSEIFINMPENGYEVKVNDTINMSPKITYDFYSTYSWILDDDIVWKEKDLQLIPKSLNKYEYTFSVSNDRGTHEMEILVQSMYKTDFEEIDFNTEVDTFWTNSTNNLSFISDQIQFETKGNYSSEIWTGFTYSNHVGSNTTEDYEKYSCYSKPTDFDSSVFGVLLLDAYNPVSMTTVDNENHLFKSISVNNSYYVYNSIFKGTNGSKKFGGELGNEKDSLILKITGFNNSGTQRGSVEILLADYTAGSSRSSTIIDEWTEFNLEDIGKVSRLEFEMISSDIENGTVNTPPYVCIDEIKIIE